MIPLRGSGTDNTMLTHFVDKRRALHPQALGRPVPATHDPIAGLERGYNVIPLYLFKTGHGCVRLPYGREWLEFGRGCPQNSVRRKDNSALDEVLQFADVSRPAISHERIHRFCRDSVNSLVHASRVLLCEMPDKLRDV